MSTAPMLFETGPATVVTLWTKATAPHEPVMDLSRDYHRGLEGCTSCQEHKADRSRPTCGSAPCASCHWSRTDVRKHREARASKVRAFLRKGDKALPPLRPTFKPKPLFPPGFKPEAVVLPKTVGYGEAVMSKRNQMPLPTLSETVERYLAAMGETKVRENRGDGSLLRLAWTCGCFTTTHDVNACERHMRPINGREDD